MLRWIRSWFALSDLATYELLKRGPLMRFLFLRDGMMAPLVNEWAARLEVRRHRR